MPLFRFHVSFPECSCSYGLPCSLEARAKRSGLEGALFSFALWNTPLVGQGVCALWPLSGVSFERALLLCWDVTGSQVALGTRASPSHVRLFQEWEVRLMLHRHCTHIKKYIDMHTYKIMYTYIHTDIHTYMHVRTGVYIYIHIYEYIHIYIHIHNHILYVHLRV